MKNINIALRVSLFVSLMLVFTYAYSAEKPATTEIKTLVPPPIATITGVVTAKMDPKGAVSDVSLTTVDGKIFKVVVNGNGEKLGKELNGKTAEVDPELVIITYKKAGGPEKPSTPSVEPTKEIEDKAKETIKGAVKETETTATKVEKEVKPVQDVVWTGIVAVAKDEKGKINAISFATDDKKVWQVTVDENSTKMANELNGQKAEITFALNVKSYKAVEAVKPEKDIGKMSEKIEKEIKTEIKAIEKEPKDK